MSMIVSLTIVTRLIGKHNLFMDLLKSLDVDQAELRLLTSLYWNQTAAVRCDDDISNEH